MSDADFEIPFERLPERFAETVGDPPAVPATPRPAATIVLLRDGLRDGSGGMQVLLMRRNRSAGFVPGAYVFPGGRVDGSDATPDVVARTDGLTPESAAARLGLPHESEPHESEPPALAYYLAALREAFEETGILVGTRPDGTPAPTAAESPAVDEIRDALMLDRISFAEALSRLDCRIAGEAVEYIAHWVTPEAEPRRYDTRFFAAQVPAGATAIIDRREMTDALWLTPPDALGRCERGEVPMVFPTIRTLQELAAFDTPHAALRSYADAPVRTIMPRLVVTPTGVGLRIDEAAP